MSQYMTSKAAELERHRMIEDARLSARIRSAKERANELRAAADQLQPLSPFAARWLRDRAKAVELMA